MRVNQINYADINKNQKVNLQQKREMLIPKDILALGTKSNPKLTTDTVIFKNR